MLFLLLALLTTLPGCGGCRKQPDAEEEKEKEKQRAEEKAKKEKEKPKPPLEVVQYSLLPPTQCKPGHWVGVQLVGAKANLEDFNGQLEVGVLDGQLHPAPLVAAPYEMTSYRPAVLAKEQPKSLEALTWVPPTREASSLDCKLMSLRGAGYGTEHPIGLIKMQSFQYYFVVLARFPARYDYLDKSLYSIHARHHTGLGAGGYGNDESGPVLYRVAQMPPKQRPGLPSRALFWTSIAYVLWDDADPALMDLDQQQAMLDWLHWGGQLIVSGPDSLDTLRSSFLGPYLPATATGSRTLSAADLAALEYWSTEDHKPPRALQPWSGVQLSKDARARTLPHTGGLVVERPVGRGRIVVSAFRLTGPEVTQWKGYDGLFNACLLRRPARRFYLDQEGGRRANWAIAGGPAVKRTPRSRRGGVPPAMPSNWQIEVATAGDLRDAAYTTKLRYFVRDAGVPFGSYAADVMAEQREVDAENADFDPTPQDPFSANGGQNPYSGGGLLAAPGLGAWNDFSPVAQAARKALADASGIKVPERSFIIWVVVAYLIVLVPMNWAFFRMIGRVEWAWIAAPLIAIGCTVLVVHLAQLNVGFARSQNEIAVVEVQPDYRRAHVARYTALYTSLATQYEFQLPDPGAQAMPFPRVDAPEKFSLRTWQSRQKLVCRRAEDTRLTGFGVASNAIDFIHSEEMIDLGGTISLVHAENGTLQVLNQTPHTLDNVQVIRKPGPAQSVMSLLVNTFVAEQVTPQKSPDGLEIARLDHLPPGKSAVLDFKEVEKPDAEKATNPPRPASTGPTGELSLASLIDLAAGGQDLHPGQIRLVASIGSGIPELHVEPTTRQSHQAVLVVANLDDGPGETPAPDVNSRQEVEEPEPEPGSPSLPLPAQPLPTTPDPTDPFG